MQKLANAVLRQNQFGSTVQLKNVTPAQVLVLTSMFHMAAGGDPFETRGKVQGLVEIPEDRESKLIEIEQKIVDENELLLETLDDHDLTTEIREKRENAYRARILAAEDRIAALRAVEQIRKLTPDMEKRRLVDLYGKKYVEPLFPSAIPALPETFEQAKKIGLQNSSELSGLDGHLFLTEGKAAA